jgi:hypothetical protein
MNIEKYIGLDVHQATISVAMLDHTGKLVMECMMETQAATIVWNSVPLCQSLALNFATIAVMSSCCS